MPPQGEHTQGANTQVQTFAGIDSGRVAEVVSAVWEHRDDVAGAIAFVRDHGDDLVRLAGRLPELLAGTAEFLTEAAGDARSAAAFLTGAGGDGGVKSLTGLAGTALDACRDELTGATQLLNRLGDELAGIPIPRVSPTYTEVFGQRLVTGLDVGAGNLLAPARDQLRAGAARFEQVGAQLATVAELLRRIGGLVDHAGQGLTETAGKLEQGGQALAALTDRPGDRPTG